MFITLTTYVSVRVNNVSFNIITTNSIKGMRSLNNIIFSYCLCASIGQLLNGVQRCLLHLPNACATCVHLFGAKDS